MRLGLASAGLASLAAAPIVLIACGGDAKSEFPSGPDASTIDAPDDWFCFCGTDSPPGPPPCVNLECQQVQCTSGKTTLSGTVFAPNGTLPLPGVTVYVPNAPPAPITTGTSSCDPSCKSQLSGSPLVTTRTDAQGKFVLENVPVGSNIPLVLQVGKWRRQVIVPVVEPCVDNSLAPSSGRLPAKRTEGNLPKIAVTTGSDPIACLLPKLGVDASELGVSSAAPARVTLYAGDGGTGPTGIASASTLWNSATELAKFDVVILGSESADHPENKTSPAVLRDWVNAGGKLFATHHQAVWFRDLVPEWKTTAAWGAATGTTPATIDTSFPFGKELSDWRGGSQVTLTAVDPSVAAVSSPTLGWVRPTTGTATHVLSFGAPVGAKWDVQCGRVAYAGMDVGSASDVVDATFPTGCSSTLTEQEKVLAYLFFRLTACNASSSGPGGE